MPAAYARRVELLGDADFKEKGVRVTVAKNMVVEGTLRVLGNIRVQGTTTVASIAKLGQDPKTISNLGPVQNGAIGEIERRRRCIEDSIDLELTDARNPSLRIQGR